MIRRSSGKTFPVLGFAVLVMTMGALAGCATGPGPSVSTPQPAADDPLPPPVLVTATTTLPPVPDTAPRGPLVPRPEVEGTYQARLSAASSPGRLVTLELRPGGLAVMGTDPLDGRPPVVRGGTWRADGDERVAVELAPAGGAARDRIVFRVIPDTLRAVELDRAAYGSAGLDLVIVEHPFSAFSEPGTWRAPGGAALTLRPDRTFLRREGGAVGVGRWSVLEDRTLVLYGGGAPRRYAIQEGDGGEQLLVSGAERLAWVEEVDTFGEPFRMRGTYVYMADAGLFTECLTAKRLPVAQERANAELERAYLRARPAPGAPVLVEVLGRFVMRVNSDTGQPEEVVVVDSVGRVAPRETCEGGRDRAAAPSSSSPPSLSTTPSRLEGTRWELAELRGAAVDAAARMRPALEFLAGGRAAGSAGCNSIYGPYRAGADSRLHLGPLATTRRACPSEDASREQAYFGALSATTRYAVAGRELTLYAGSDAVARFRRSGS